MTARIRDPGQPAMLNPPRGRFAPSPTGPLHLGSLLAAAGSYLESRTRGGTWLVRMEDIDRTREVPGAADGILRTLEQFGFEWDGPVERQSDRIPRYAAALRQLEAAGLAYPCTCSRSQLARLSRSSDGEPVYPGTCRAGVVNRTIPAAVRLRTDRAQRVPVEIEDRLQGRVIQDVAQDVGDFVIRRRDGYFAYQLAVVVDDADQGITDIVRGCDLLDSTPRQVLLQQALGLPTPSYAHLPLLVEADGAKLSKSRHSVPLDPGRAPALLVEVLALLEQHPPAELARNRVRDVWSWALEAWNPRPLRGRREINLPIDLGQAPL